MKGEEKRETDRKGKDSLSKGRLSPRSVDKRQGLRERKREDGISSSTIRIPRKVVTSWDNLRKDLLLKGKSSHHVGF